MGALGWGEVEEVGTVRARAWAGGSMAWEGCLELQWAGTWTGVSKALG